jgi:phosphoglycolate phosphatase-like HAD superfamily hydrolase
VIPTPARAAGNWQAGRVTEPSPPYAVIDLDGVLADVRHRLHYLESTPKDWDGFFAALTDDPVLADGRAVVDRLGADHELVYLTGRPQSTRADNEAWLDRHGFPRARLIMRSARDRRPARQTKPALLRELVADGGRVAVVVDDDPQVCDALEQAGWPVFRADWMPRPETLTEAQETRGRT